MHSGGYPSQAADMVADYYPNAWTRIRNAEKKLNVAADKQLNIQMMVRTPSSTTLVCRC